jgi:hypothetical protein
MYKSIEQRQGEAGTGASGGGREILRADSGRISYQLMSLDREGVTLHRYRRKLGDVFAYAAYSSGRVRVSCY